MKELAQYSKILQEIKQEIREGRYKAVLAANKELIIRYWSIGNIILKYQKLKDGEAKLLIPLQRIYLQNFLTCKAFPLET